MFQTPFLANKRILVTGGGTGLGKAMGLSFLKNGATALVITGRRQQILEETILEWKRDHPEATFAALPCDIRDAESVKQIIDHAVGTLKCNVVVNNAAGNFLAQSKDLSHRALDAVLGTVLHGTAYVTLEAGKQWIANETKGVFLNIVTTYASTGSAFVLPSAMGKAAVLAMTRSLAVEWAPYGIRSVAIAPGPIPTDGAWSRLMPSEALAQAMLEKNPLKRFGKPEELGNLASFLVSDLGGYINGDCITMDGGEWLQGAGEFSFMGKHVSDSQWQAMKGRK